MQKLLYRFGQFARFYAAARTRYQVHSPLIFDLANAVLEDRRRYYAFDDVEAVRRKMFQSPVILEMDDYGRAEKGALPVRRQVPLRNVVLMAASSPRQGRRLFRLIQWLKPARILELGTSVGIGTMYMAAAARKARLISLEGSEACAQVARANLEILGLRPPAEVFTGSFHQTLEPALRELGQVDLVYIDGHHRRQPTLDYFEQCLAFAHDRTVLVLDDIHWSPEMNRAWTEIQAHPRVSVTVDCFDLGIVFLTPDVREKQHYRLLPGAWKPWKMV